MDKFAAFVKLTRVEHSLLLIVAVIAAELIVGGLPNWYVLLLSILSPALISMGAFAINDYFDVATDRANKRFDRPIVSGAIRKHDAYLIAISCLAGGTLISLFINPLVFLVAAIFAVLAYLYSYMLKDMLLWGNAYVALTMVIPFIYGDLVVSGTIAIDIALISMMIFLVGLAREIHGMIRDRRGDAIARKTRGLVANVGVRNSALIAMVLYLEGIMISLYMFFFDMPFRANLIYVLPVAVADLIFLYIAVGHVLNNKRRFHDRARNLSLAAMGLALAAFLFSAVYYAAV